MTGWTTWAKRAALGATVCAVPVVAMSLVGMDPRPLPIAALVAVGVLVGSLLVDLGSETAGSWWPVASRTEPRVAEDGRARQLQRAVEAATLRNGSGTGLRTALAGVAADRVRRAHGIDRDADPEGFAAIAGADLAAWLDQPPDEQRPATLRELHDHVTRIEALSPE